MKESLTYQKCRLSPQGITGFFISDFYIFVVHYRRVHYEKATFTFNNYFHLSLGAKR